jgi:hypothetical protein
VYGQADSHLFVDLLQAVQELVVGGARQALADDGSSQYVQGGEQGGGAAALLVVGHRPRPAPFHGQRGLGAV